MILTNPAIPSFMCLKCPNKNICQGHFDWTWSLELSNFGNLFCQKHDWVCHSILIFLSKEWRSRRVWNKSLSIIQTKNLTVNDNKDRSIQGLWSTSLRFDRKICTWRDTSLLQKCCRFTGRQKHTVKWVPKKPVYVVCECVFFLSNVYGWMHACIRPLSGTARLELTEKWRSPSAPFIASHESTITNSIVEHSTSLVTAVVHWRRRRR